MAHNSLAWNRAKSPKTFVLSKFSKAHTRHRMRIRTPSLYLKICSLSVQVSGLFKQFLYLEPEYYISRLYSRVVNTTTMIYIDRMWRSFIAKQQQQKIIIIMNLCVCVILNHAQMFKRKFSHLEKKESEKGNTHKKRLASHYSQKLVCWP